MRIISRQSYPFPVVNAGSTPAPASGHDAQRSASGPRLCRNRRAPPASKPILSTTIQKTGRQMAERTKRRSRSLSARPTLPLNANPARPRFIERISQANAIGRATAGGGASPVADGTAARAEAAEPPLRRRGAGTRRAEKWTPLRPPDPCGPPGRAWSPVDLQGAQGRDGRTAGSARQPGRTIYLARMAPGVPVSTSICRKRRASHGYCPAVCPRARIQALAANAVTSGRHKGQRIARRTAPGHPGNSARPTIRTGTPKTAETGDNWARHSRHTET